MATATQSYEPQIAVYVCAGETAPLIFSTASRPSEYRRMKEWLESQPPLAALVESAVQLADEHEDPST